MAILSGGVSKAPAGIRRDGGGLEENKPSYWRYWGKAKPENGNQSVACHLLPYHSLDVAAVGCLLLDRHPSLATRMAGALDLSVESFSHLFVHSLALHDIGKFSRSFQGLARPQELGLVPPIPGMTYRERHDALGALVWSEDLAFRLLGRQDGAADQAIDPDVEDALDLWMGCFFGHHGKPVRAGGSPLEAHFTDDDRTALRAFANDLTAFLPADWPMDRLRDERWRVEVLAPATWQIAGLAILADWLGSNAHYFRYASAPQLLCQYWEERALPAAREVLASSGLIELARPVAFPGFRHAFGLEPSPLQSWASTTALPEGPQLFLLEDITGSGKTEAAVAIAHRLLAKGLADGIYFGLPTMATSNAMYRRLGNYYRGLFEADAHASLVLAHGARDLNETFRASIVPESNSDFGYTSAENSAGMECRSWFADSRKTALLAEVGVGTVDQALLGVLPRKHQALRLLGLSRKVLVVDEVHAYDTYSRGLLCTLLEGHARQGGCAILLSATMPGALRRDFLQAWRRGRGGEDDPCATSAEFPLATHIDDKDVAQIAIEARPSSRRNLPVEFVHDTEHAEQIILGAAAAGRCACWVRNTVEDAIDAYERLRARLDEPDNVLLFHARFTMGDRQRIEDEALDRFGSHSGGDQRQGRVLVATQVVEQSLDLDFDVLVTDLAPIDLIIQRAGRLHRHIRNANGDRLIDAARDERPSPLLHLLSPPWTDEPQTEWVRDHLRGTSFVYSDPAQLWRTARVLREEGAIVLPERARTLLEAVYGGDAPTPDALKDAHYDHYAAERAAASGARFNALRLGRGYCLGGDGAGWDDDQEIGTRLSDERTVRVVLLREAAGALKPWHEHGPHPWAMSTVSLREGLARRLPVLPDAFAQHVDALREAHPALRYMRLWLPQELDGKKEPRYDAALGAVIPR